MTAEMMRRRADTMVAWFAEQLDRSTTKRDREQAMAFDVAAPDEGWVHAGALDGDERLVRAVRRWIDKQHDGEFAEYRFGTKRSGRGVTHTVMYAKDARLASAANGTVSQALAAEQHERRTAEELGRMVLKFQAESEEWFQLGDYARSMVCRDAANDLDQFGRLRQQTKQAMARLGLLS